jgi:hypothetical protein
MADADAINMEDKMAGFDNGAGGLLTGMAQNSKRRRYNDISCATVLQSSEMQKRCVDQEELQRILALVEADPEFGERIYKAFRARLARIFHPDGKCYHCEQPADLYLPIGPIKVTASDPETIGPEGVASCMNSAPGFASLVLRLRKPAAILLSTRSHLMPKKSKSKSKPKFKTAEAIGRQAREHFERREREDHERVLAVIAEFGGQNTSDESWSRKMILATTWSSWHWPTRSCSCGTTWLA